MDVQSTMHIFDLDNDLLVRWWPAERVLVSTHLLPSS
jgi:hypothetical protein